MSRLVKLMSRYILEILSLAMLTAALVFFVNAHEMKQKLRDGNPEVFSNGDIVTVTKAIDGDEVQVQHADGHRTIVRLLGIKSFAPTISDPKLSEYGQIAYDYLKSQADGKEARLELAGTKVDSKKRLLAYVHLKDPTGIEVDAGKDMISKGYTLVYLRYNFSRMKEYMATEAQAQAGKAGFWSNPAVTKRAHAMKGLWLEEKLQDD